MVRVIDLVKILLSQKGDRYKFGVDVSSLDSDPDAFDCSELIKWGCARLSITPTMPDGSWNQYQHCYSKAPTISVERGLIQAGALLFIFQGSPFGTVRPDQAHVAMSLGNGMTIEARSEKWGVGVFTVDKRGWTHAGLIPGLAY
ncbi:C40 family peptidase [Paucibacter sp. DJ1R-11]|uniref:C40 family peptidase n=1 Tax=Paucibacter sp. DJ1R-11 TaxID=2893556 RepID=UPI0021E415F6|nr:C40 family peptidase [Paucibacter sp. DJ1R-11]MCV2361966.1 C40 family peptidase [Paucibacter sp. DJ1R-11]